MSRIAPTGDSKYDPLAELDIDELVERLTPGEIQKLLDECDPDDPHIPPSLRSNYKCAKEDTGPLNRKHLLEFINDQALNTPDIVDVVPFESGTVRGRKWVPPPKQKPEQLFDEEIELDIDLGDDVELALNSATTEDIIDLAGIMGLHSMMNQDQFHTSQGMKNARADPELGWNGITKATPLKVYPKEEPNRTDPADVKKKLAANDSETKEVNLNNVPVSESVFLEIFDALKENDVLSDLSAANTTMTDFAAANLAKSMEANTSLEKINIESNNINPATLTKLFEAIETNQNLTQVKASNQQSQFLGNKVEMAITKSIENNKTLLKVGLHFEYGDCRNRVAVQLQKNLDRIRLKRIAHKLAQRGNNTAGYFAPPPGAIPRQKKKEATPDSEYEYYYESDEAEEAR